MRPASSRSSARRAMTLVEISMVLLILAVSLIAVASLGYLALRDKEQLKGEARKLAGFLEHIRSLAALNGRVYTVQYNLDFENHMYFVWAPGRPDSGEIYEEDLDLDLPRVAMGFNPFPTIQRAGGVREYNVWIAEIRYGDGSQARGRDVRFDFHPRGGGHWHYVYLTNANDEFYTIEVNPFTGKAEVYPGYLQPEPPERLQ
jgi:type II secretory pathway pseudopilin PulG